MFETMIKLQVLENNPFEDQRANSPFNPNGDATFKKCCKKYKKGKRCKKCPGRSE
jgi:hypothetical protein